MLGGPALAGLRLRLRRRYELGRGSDVFTLTEISFDERRALEGLLGRRTRRAGSIQLSMAELDEALARAGLASSLRDGLEQLDGPIRDLALERANRAARWDAAFNACTFPRLADLIAQNAGRGLVKRLAHGDPEQGLRLLEAAAQVLAQLPRHGVPLSRLAAGTLGDAHALDEGRPVGTLVLAAVRGTGDEDRPREVWAKWGVLVGELASPALALNLPAAPNTPAGRIAAQASALGEPIYLSLRMLLRTPPHWEASGHTVFVSENPAVVAMAADRLAARCAPLVCTDGMPSAAQRALLAQLAAAGAVLRYHGDFDWPGVVIGNFVMRTFKAKPWRFSTSDYDASSGRRLVGDPSVADWDAELAPKMTKRGYALDEEAVIDSLLDDLALRIG